MSKEPKNRRGEKRVQREREREGNASSLVLGRRSGCLLRERIIVVDGRLRCRLTRRGEIRENKKYARSQKLVGAVKSLCVGNRDCWWVVALQFQRGTHQLAAPRERKIEAVRKVKIFARPPQGTPWCYRTVHFSLV